MMISPFKLSAMRMARRQGVGERRHRPSCFECSSFSKPLTRLWAGNADDSVTAELHTSCRTRDRVNAGAQGRK